MSPNGNNEKDLVDTVQEIDSRLISYSINAEDVLLRRIFPDRSMGFFVDVGAEDPVNGNDFFGLYQLGWRGINIEPNPAYFSLLQQKRPEDRNVQLLVSDAPSEALPFFIVEGTGLSTCDAAMAATHAEHLAGVHRVEMRAATLMQILDEANPPHINVLKIDVEGFEEQVLRGNDWDRYRPSLIMIEVTLPQSPERRETGITNYLQARGYNFAYHDGLNDFFVEKDFTPPPNSFRSPNVFDNVVRWETIALRNDYNALHLGFTEVEHYAKALEGERVLVGEALSTASEQLQDKQRSEQRLTAELQATQRLATDLLAHGDERVDMILAESRLIADPSQIPAEIAPGDTGRELVVLEGREASAEDNDPATAIHLALVQARLTSLRRERDRLAEQVKDLEFQNQRLAAGNAQLQGERLALHRALDQERSHLHILAEARRTLSSLRDLVDGEKTIRAEKADAVAARLERANAEAERLEREGQELARQHSEKAEQARRDRVAVRYGGMRPAHDSDQAMIEALYASTSWKLTQPVRVLGRLLRVKKS